MDELLHVISRVVWERVSVVSCPPGGFIHLCTPAQLGFVLERHFAGQQGLLLLTLDPAGLDIRWETSEPDMPPFPHLYGDLPAASVVRTRAL